MGWGSEGDLFKAGPQAHDDKNISSTGILSTLSRGPQLNTVGGSVLWVETLGCSQPVY